MSGVGFDPVAWAEAETAHMTPAEVADVQAFLVGIFATYVDNPDLPPLTAARWREFVRLAVVDATHEGAGDDPASHL